MIPKRERLTEQFEVVRQPNLTWGLDVERQCLVGLIDGLEAVRQAIYKILATQRYEELVYSPRYGAEIRDLAGSSQDVIRSVLKNRITSALLYDDRIKKVRDFAYEQQGNVLRVTFVAETSEGTLRIEKGVSLLV